MEEFTEEQQQHINQLIADTKATWESEHLAPVIAERDELRQFKPKEENEQEKMIKQLQAELNHQKLVAKLRNSNLDDFIDFLNVDDNEDLQNKIDRLNVVLESRKLSNNYVPDNHKQTNAYDQAASKGDTLGMISAKINKLFN
ncbi:hypothetical protein FHR92_004153 [Fontibacillus solani]|uniref:DUF4355 domain-containing protein n=1 Tax=Fontibacillus solani TaxID=1572857 RepID=A0A7W3SXC5_9BACL|nr:hypothetical protein [Fontibacillus solani]MBA9087668.1 hypothetical protein [Fontibacillus solani]